MAYIGNTSTTQSFTPAVDYFSGNGSTTAFTLSRPVASVAQVQAVIENVAQNPSTAFTVNGNTITFTSAPPTGSNNIYIYYTSPITQLIAPSDGTVGTSALATGAVTPTKLSTGAPTWDTSGNVFIGGTTVATATAPIYSSTTAKAWCNFNGVTTATIRGSYNISSITRTATGAYTANFTTALPNLNYAMVGQAWYAGVSGALFAIEGTPTSTTSKNFTTSNPSAANSIDTNYISFAVFG